MYGDVHFIILVLKKQHVSNGKATWRSFKALFRGKDHLGVAQN